MSPSSWGPPTWIFMHTLAAKIKEESFPTIGQSLITLMIQICDNLPCPDCAQHAKEFWSHVKPSNIKNKQDLIDLLFVFHNIVNKRKQYKSFNYSDLSCYNNRKIVDTYNAFSKNFNTKGNMNLINESFRRNMFLGNLRNWLMSNIRHFELTPRGDTIN
jgi:hypothetical protein